MAIRLGIIGYGIMGERLQRAAAAHDPQVIAVSGVWDPSPEAMQRLEGAFPDIARPSTVEDLIAQADCVYVASPPASHLAHARAALTAGKALFCEKPLAVDVTDARRFVAQAEETGARAGVNFPFASSVAVDRLKAWMADGTVGAPRRVLIETAFAHWPRPWQLDAAEWLDRTAQGGFTREVVSHFLFLTRRLIGPLDLRRASADYPEPGRSERAITADFIVGTLPVSLTGGVGTTTKADHNTWTLEGTEGTVRLRDWSFAERHESTGEWAEAPDAVPNEEARPIVLARQLDKVAAMTRGEAHDLATLREALDVQEAVETILRSPAQA